MNKSSFQHVARLCRFARRSNRLFRLASPRTFLIIPYYMSRKSNKKKKKLWPTSSNTVSCGYASWKRLQRATQRAIHPWQLPSSQRQSSLRVHLYYLLPKHWLLLADSRVVHHWNEWILPCHDSSCPQTDRQHKFFIKPAKKICTKLVARPPFLTH